MKKYARLFCVTAALLLCALAIPEIEEANLPEVTVAALKKQKIQETIVCNGTLREGENEKLSCEVPIFPSEIKVKKGDRVEKGDLLIAVDRMQSTAVLASAGIGGQLSGRNIDASAVPAAVYAPVGGTVTSVNVQQGRMASPAATLITISDSSSMQAVVQVSENQINEVKPNQQVRITGVGFKGNEYIGTVKEISADAKQIMNGAAVQTVVEVSVAINDADEKLKAGFSSKAEIITTPETEKLIIPYEAVDQDDDGNEFVYVYQDGRAEKCVITTGKEYNCGFEVLSGISEGENIVCDASQIKKDGGFVKAFPEEAVNA